MRLSLYSSIGFKNPFGLARVFEIASDLGYAAVEVRGHSLDVARIEERNRNALGYDMIGPNSLDHTGTEALRDRLRACNLEFSGISCYNALTLPEGELAQQCFEKYREMMDYAGIMNIPWVRLIGFSETPYPGISLSRDESRRLMARRIKQLCAYGKNINVGILLENGENSIPNRSRETLELAGMIDSDNLGIVFDVYNAVFEGLDPLQEMKILAGHITCLHVKNARSRMVAATDYSPKGDTGFRWTLLTDGDVDYGAIMEEALSQGFNGDIVCEYANPYKGMSREFWDSLPDARHWAENARDFLLQYME